MHKKITKRFIMKKVHYLICFCVLALFAIEHIYAATNEPVKSEVDLEKFRNDIRTDSRSLMDYLEVTYDPTTLCLEIQHCGLGDTTIIIVDNNGKLVEERNFISAGFDIEHIFLPSPSKYQIHIYADTMYAVGHVR